MPRESIQAAGRPARPPRPTSKNRRPWMPQSWRSAWAASRKLRPAGLAPPVGAPGASSFMPPVPLTATGMSQSRRLVPSFGVLRPATAVTWYTPAPRPVPSGSRSARPSNAFTDSGCSWPSGSTRVNRADRSAGETGKRAAARSKCSAAGTCPATCRGKAIEDPHGLLDDHHGVPSGGDAGRDKQHLAAAPLRRTMKGSPLVNRPITLGLPARRVLRREL